MTNMAQSKKLDTYINIYEYDLMMEGHSACSDDRCTIARLADSLGILGLREAYLLADIFSLVVHNEPSLSTLHVESL